MHRCPTAKSLVTRSRSASSTSCAHGLLLTSAAKSEAVYINSRQRTTQLVDLPRRDASLRGEEANGRRWNIACRGRAPFTLRSSCLCARLLCLAHFIKSKNILLSTLIIHGNVFVVNKFVAASGDRKQLLDALAFIILK